MMKFTPLSIPAAPLKLVERNNAVYVWDEFRSKSILLTPEEWVRQHFLHFLVDHKGFPKGRISVEHSLVINSLARRCDALVYSDQLNPLVIIECKAPEINLSLKTLEQIAQYNFELRVNYLVLTNGLQTIVAVLDAENKTIHYLKEVPDYNAIIG